MSHQQVPAAKKRDHKSMIKQKIVKTDEIVPKVMKKEGRMKTNKVIKNQA
jgi:hypothetical protein